MRKIVILTIISLLIINILNAEENINRNYSKSDFIGSWKYVVDEIDDEDISIIINSIDTYKKDGTLLTKGDIKFFDKNKTLLANTKTEFISEWNVVKDNIIEQIKECKFDKVIKDKNPKTTMFLDMILKMMCNAEAKGSQKIIYMSDDRILLELLNEKTELIRIR